MDIITVEKNELGYVLQEVTLVNVRFGYCDTWIATPVLFAASGCIEILMDLKKSRYIVEYGEKVMLKFQKMGYEYILNGEIVEMTVSDPATATIEIFDGSKYYNQRRHVRYETDHEVLVLTQAGDYVKSIAKNISEGGVMFLCASDVGLDMLTELEIDFGPFGLFRSKGKILRKSWYDQRQLSYGVQFVDTSEKNEQVLRKGITQYEKEYSRMMNALQPEKGSWKSKYQTAIGIFSLGRQESYEIKESLVKLGAGNFSVFHDFSFYIDFFSDEKPRLAIIEADCLEEELTKNIADLKNSFPAVTVIAVLPVQEREAYDHAEAEELGLIVVYKPLIYNEFEETIIKYL